MPPPAGERNGSWRSLSLEEATDLLRKHAWSICHAAKADGRDFTCFKRHLVELGFDVVDLKRMNRDTRRAQILAGAANARAARKENNHVVTRVEVLGVEDDVFDLMIEEHHNFIAGELSSANCTDPNLQNIPRASGSPEGKMARDCFAAPPGYKLVELDYSQLELRVACLLSGDPKMLEIFRSGVDYHLRTAQLVSMTAWGVDLTNNSVSKEDAKEYRTRAKAVNFGALYGKGAGGLAEEWGCSMSKAQEVIDLIMGQFKVLDRWCDDRLREAQKTGVVWTWWDGENARRRPLYRVADKSSENDKSRSVAENGAVNSPIQGTASDFCVSSLTACIDWIEQDRLDGVKLVLPVHDALMFEVRDDMVDEVAHVAAHIMRSWPFGDVPLVVDCKVGQSWGTMEEYDVAA